MENGNENVKRESIKSTSMRLSAETLKALKEVAKKESLPNQDSTIQWLLAATSFAKATNRVPERSQTLSEIQELFARIISKIEDNFNMMADVKTDAEKKICDKEAELNAKINLLKQQINENDIKIATLQEALNSVHGIHGFANPVPESTHEDCIASATGVPDSEDSKQGV